MRHGQHVAVWFMPYLHLTLSVFFDMMQGILHSPCGQMDEEWQR
ncbi:hypothetical protein HMPREF9166_0452 [Selenomonas sp. oral taxon 149 str. 67H29BP]|nr:hypothetical protein HMPREF9166_0452 [Selenomonas sp. oral taxon 149 str. 67H29BP]